MIDKEKNKIRLTSEQSVEASNCVKTVCVWIYVALVVTCSMVLTVVLLMEVLDDMLFDRFRSSSNQIMSSKVADSDANELFYLSGHELSLTDWRYCILKLKMDLWALHSSIGREMSRHYSIYYYAIEVSAAFLMFCIMLSILIRKKEWRRIFSKRMIMDVIVMFWGGGVVCAITFLPRPSVLAKIEQECRFLSRRTKPFETPRFKGTVYGGYVVIADSPLFEDWCAIPELGESYDEYVKRRHERAGMNRSPVPGWKKGPNGWYNENEGARDFKDKRDFKDERFGDLR